MRTARLVPAIVMLSAAGGLAVWMLSDGSPASGPAAGPPGAGRHQAAENVSRFAPLSRRGWGLGTRYSYQLQVSTQVQQSGETAPRNIEIAGRWTSTVIRASDSERDLEIVFEPQPAGSTIQTFVARYDGQGKATGLLFAGTPPPDTVSAARELVTSFQVSLPPANPARWSATELDPGGEVAVEYQRVSEDCVLRRKQRFLKVLTAAGLAPPAVGDVVPTILQSHGDYQLDGAGRIKNALVRYAAVAKANLGVEVKVETIASWRFLAQDQVPARAPVAALKAVSLTLDDSDFQAAEEDAARNAVKGASARKLMTNLRKAHQAKKPAAIATAQYRLSQLLKLDDDATLEVATAIRRGRHEQSIYPVLAAAGTPLAQSTLLAVASSAATPAEDCLNAIRSIHGIFRPTPETISATEALAFDGTPAVKNAGSLALGTVAGRILPTQPALARDKVLRLAAEYDPALPADEKRRILNALGNSDSVDALPTLRLGLADPLVDIRRTAIMALRTIPCPEVEQILAGLIDGERDPVLRTAAIWAAEGQRFAPLAAALEAFLRSERDAKLRYKALHLVMAFYRREQSPDIARLLQTVADSDDEPQLREDAKEALEAKRGA